MSHQYHIGITSITHRYHISITSVSHRCAASDFFTLHPPPTRQSNVSLTTHKSRRTSHKTFHGTSRGTSYYIRAPQAIFFILPPRASRKFIFLYYLCEPPRTIDLSGKNNRSPCMQTKNYPRPTLSDRNHRSPCMNTKKLPEAHFER